MVEVLGLSLSVLASSVLKIAANSPTELSPATVYMYQSTHMVSLGLMWQEEFSLPLHRIERRPAGLSQG